MIGPGSDKNTLCWTKLFIVHTSSHTNWHVHFWLCREQFILYTGWALDDWEGVNKTFLYSPLPLNEWMESHHWHHWFYDGFWSPKPLVAMVFQWILVQKPLLAMVFQWFWSPKPLVAMVFQWFWVQKPLVAMVFQWFPMVANHWSDDGMVTIHRSGLWPQKFPESVKSFLENV